MNRRRFLKTLGWTALGVGLGGPTYAWASGHSFAVNSHRVPFERLRAPLRVAHLTDLHFGRWHKEASVRGWVDATLKQRPDLIVITGDIVDGATHPNRLQALARELARLEAPLGVYAVLGNHDYGAPRNGWRKERLIEALERVGVKYLVNEGVSLRDDFYLAGVDDYWFGTVNSAKATRGAKDDQAVLMLCHNPDVLPKLSTRIGLTLCGHTHGGQVRLPWGGVYSISRYGERFQMGFVEAPAKGFISRGLGTTGLPVRTFCPAELVIHELQPA
jgi:uncharacterized protein